MVGMYLLLPYQLSPPRTVNYCCTRAHADPMMLRKKVKMQGQLSLLLFLTIHDCPTLFLWCFLRYGMALLLVLGLSLPLYRSYD